MFDASSGSTHRLDIVAGHALKCVADGPADAATLTAAIAAYLEVSPDSQLAALVDDLLTRLMALGLIEADR